MTNFWVPKVSQAKPTRGAKLFEVLIPETGIADLRSGRRLVGIKRTVDWKERVRIAVDRNTRRGDTVSNRRHRGAEVIVGINILLEVMGRTEIFPTETQVQRQMIADPPVILCVSSNLVSPVPTIEVR